MGGGLVAVRVCGCVLVGDVVVVWADVLVGCW